MASPAGVIDFNSDLGESFGSYTMGLDEEIIKQVTSVNVATGFHAGDPDCMARTVRLAEENGVRVGAHPAYPDLAGFGRRDLDMSPAEIQNAVTYQIGALAAFTSDHQLQHVKPHGAMYNKAVRDPSEATAIVNAVKAFSPDLIHVVLGRFPMGGNRTGSRGESGARVLCGQGRHARRKAGAAISAGRRDPRRGRGDSTFPTARHGGPRDSGRRIDNRFPGRFDLPAWGHGRGGGTGGGGAARVGVGRRRDSPDVRNRPLTLN